MDLKSFFNEYAKNDMESFKDSIDNLSSEKKKRLCFKWHYQGVAKKDLASFFGVSLRTVYQWLKEENSGLLEEFEVKSGLELLIEQFAELEQYEKLCMVEASHLGNSQLEIDPETGDKRIKGPTSKGLENKAKFIDLARKFREMQINLLTQTGLIPKQPDKIYNAVKDNKLELEESEQTANINKLDKPDLSKTVIEKLMKQTNL
jgi:hypothetical protein